MPKREYGVVLSTRMGAACVKVTANGKQEARKEVQMHVRSYRIGPFGGGQVYTGVLVDLLENYPPAYRAVFVTVDEAVDRIDEAGFINNRWGN